MRILFVHEVSYEKKPIFEMHEFPEYLAARGHEVTFLQFDEGYRFWLDKRQPAERTIPGRILAGTSIKIVTPHQFGIPGLDRIYAIFSVWNPLERVLKYNEVDVIVLYAVPTFGLQVIHLAQKYGVPVIFRALDVSHRLRKSIYSPAIKAVEKYVYHRSDMLSANNSALARYCGDLGCRSRGTFVNLPPLDTSHFAPNNVGAVELASLRKFLGIKSSDRVITYMGSFFYFSGLDIAIREFAVLARENPRLKLLLIGGGEQDSELKTIVKDNDIVDRVIFTGFIPYGMLPTYLQLSTIAINPMRPLSVSNLALPHKILQYIAAEIPVVSTKLIGAIETLGLESGVTWADGPAAVMSEAISLVSESSRRSSSVAKQLLTARRLLSVDHAVEQFELLLNEAIEVGP